MTTQIFTDHGQFGHLPSTVKILCKAELGHNLCSSPRGRWGLVKYVDTALSELSRDVSWKRLLSFGSGLTDVVSFPEHGTLSISQVSSPPAGKERHSVDIDSIDVK